MTGFNGFDIWRYTEPVLTTVRCRACQLGARGGGAVLARPRAERFAVLEIVPPVTFLPGASIRGRIAGRSLMGQ